MCWLCDPCCVMLVWSLLCVGGAVLLVFLWCVPLCVLMLQSLFFVVQSLLCVGGEVLVVLVVQSLLLLVV